MASKKQKKRLAKAYKNNSAAQQIIEPVIDLNIRAVGKQLTQGTKVLNRIAQSELGLEMLEQAQENGCSFLFGAISGGLSGNFDPIRNMVMVATSTDIDKRAGIAIHETCHSIQNALGAFIAKDATSSVKTQLIGTRILEADAVAKEAVTCFQLNEKGDSKPWELFKEELPEVVNKIEEASNKYGKDNTKMLLNAGFKAWFDVDFFIKAYEEATTDFICRQTSNYEEREGCNPQFFTKDISIEEIAAKCCTYKGEPYISPKKEFFEKANFTKVSSKTVERIENYLGERSKKYHLIGKDNSCKNLPLYDINGKLIKLSPATPQLDTAARKNIALAKNAKASR